MSDFTLSPDDSDAAEAPRPVRLVATGLADMADLPVSRRAQPEPPPCYAPCGACGALVLTGATQAGRRLALDVGTTTYVVDWTKGTATPVFIASRGYPVHRCLSQEGAA